MRYIIFSVRATRIVQRQSGRRYRDSLAFRLMNHRCHTPGAVHQRTRERVPRRRGTAMSARNSLLHASRASKLRGVLRSTRTFYASTDVILGICNGVELSLPPFLPFSLVLFNVRRARLRVYVLFPR